METTDLSEGCIRIIRLKTGEDIISEILKVDEDKILLDSPLFISSNINKTTGKPFLIMLPWLPIMVIKHDMVEISCSDILTYMEPTDDIVELYHDGVGEFDLDDEMEVTDHTLPLTMNEDDERILTKLKKDNRLN